MARELKLLIGNTTQKVLQVALLADAVPWLADAKSHSQSESCPM